MVNDYTCPECKGTGHQYAKDIDDVVTCGRCLAVGRLPDRRSKTISDRRKYDSPGNERRKNFIFTDRRKKI